MASYFLAIHPRQGVDTATIWDFGNGIATAFSHSQQARIISGTPPQVVVEGMETFSWVPLNVGLNEAYHRMARPTARTLTDSPGTGFGIDKSRVEIFRGQLVALREQMERIFRTVHPVQQNFGAYGHDIRNFLILAATEVEAHWRGVMVANGVARASTTRDYVKLLPAMKLNEYAVTLPFYPWLDPIRPFEHWTAADPTKSLAWYDAYNAVKHDGQNSFHEGTLLHAVEAFCACAILCFAQFGRSGFHDSRQLTTFFHLASVPTWGAYEAYAIVNPNSVTMVNYPF